jgi:hypothetical protein
VIKLDYKLKVVGQRTNGRQTVTSAETGSRLLEAGNRNKVATSGKISGKWDLSPNSSLSLVCIFTNFRLYWLITLSEHFRLNTGLYYSARISQWAQQRAKGWRARVRFSASECDFVFSIVSRLALGLTQPPIQWVLGALSLEVSRRRREPDHQLRLGPRSRMVARYLYSTIIFFGVVSLPVYIYYTVYCREIFKCIMHYWN